MFWWLRVWAAWPAGSAALRNITPTTSFRGEPKGKKIGTNCLLKQYSQCHLLQRELYGFAQVFISLLNLMWVQSKSSHKAWRNYTCKDPGLYLPWGCSSHVGGMASKCFCLPGSASERNWHWDLRCLVFVWNLLIFVCRSSRLSQCKQHPCGKLHVEHFKPFIFLIGKFCIWWPQFSSLSAHCCTSRCLWHSCLWKQKPGAFLRLFSTCPFSTHVWHGAAP